ncbi:hypothetical protein Tco_1220793 [Tanacetum coccineum]
MANISEDIQSAGSNTRPPMLDRPDFESWQRKFIETLLLNGARSSRTKQIDSNAYLTPEEKERFTKLINDMRNIKMSMPKMQLNLKFVNNMLPEWGRFITAVKLNRGLKTSNYDQLYAYFKQHEAHANENKIMLEKYNQHAIDPLACVSNVSPPWVDKTEVRGTIQEERLLLEMGDFRTEQCTHPKRPRNLEYFKDKMLLMQAQENGVVLDEEQLLFLAGGQDNTFDDDVDEPSVQDLALNVDNVFQADQCDAFDSEDPTAHTMFMANLSSADPIYDEAGPLYDSDILSEVQDHYNYLDSVDEYQEVHEMHNDVQQNYIVDSDAEYTSDSNIILYDQYAKNNAEQVVQSNNKVVNESLTAELARYKEQVTIYEKRVRFELTEREQKIDEQMRIIITDRNIKEETLKRELHSVKMQLNSTIDHNKLMKEEVATLKKDFKQKENKYLKDFLDMKALKEKVKDKLFKQDQSLQIVHMLCKPKPFYDEKKKDTLEIAELIRKKMLKKMKSPLWIEEGERDFEQTKECYLTEVIPFFKMLKEHFEGIQTALVKEVKEMKEIFEQMEVEVEQNVVDKRYADIKQKNLLIENENLIADCLSYELLYSVMNVVNVVSRFYEMYDAYTVEQARCLELEAKISKLKHKIQKDDHSEMIKCFSNLEINHLNLQLKYQNLKERFGNNKSQTSQDTPEFDSFFEINKMKEQLQGKNNTIRKLKEQTSQMNERRSEADRILDFKALDSQNIELKEHVTALQKQYVRFRAKNEKVKQHYKELYDTIKITRAKTIEKTSSLLTKNEKLKAHLKGKMQCVTMPAIKPKVLAPGLYAIDVEPIPPRNRNNREVHLDYLKHLKESVETLREIVEEARIENPLDNAHENACFYTKRSQELLYVIGTYPKEFNKRDKKVATTPLNMNKQVAFRETCETSNNNTQTRVEQYKVHNTNVPVIPSIGVNSSTEASESKPRSNSKNNRIMPAKSDNEKKVED